MELFTNANREHLVDIIDNFIDQIFEKYNGSISDVISELYAADFTRQEILDILNKRYLDSYEWAEEEEANEKINTETGEGVFWKEYAEDEDVKPEEVSVGDSDQAILETALTQIGIPYTWESSRDGSGWIDLKITNNGDLTGRTAAEIYFTEDGKFDGIY